MAPSSASAPLKDARGALEQLTNARDRQAPYLLLYSDTITPLFPTNRGKRRSCGLFVPSGPAAAEGSHAKLVFKSLCSCCLTLRLSPSSKTSSQRTKKQKIRPQTYKPQGSPDRSRVEWSLSALEQGKLRHRGLTDAASQEAFGQVHRRDAVL